MRLFADSKLARIQRKKYRELQAKLHKHWDLYQAGEEIVIDLHRCAQ